MLEYNKFYQGDNRELIKKIDDESVDLYLFSPPYGDIRTYENVDYCFDYESLGNEIKRTLKEGGICSIVISDQIKNHRRDILTSKLIVDWVENKGLNLFETIIYHKHGRPGPWWNKRFRVDHEYILIFFKGDKPKYFNKEHLMVPSKHGEKKIKFPQRRTDGNFDRREMVVKNTKCRGTVWFYNTSNKDKIKEKLKHPATFPEKLCEDIILTFTEKGDLVVDPFSGSGTAPLCAYKLGRKFIGFELNQNYVDLSYEIFKKYYKTEDFFYFE